MKRAIIAICLMGCSEEITTMAPANDASIEARADRDTAGDVRDLEGSRSSGSEVSRADALELEASSSPEAAVLELEASSSPEAAGELEASSSPEADVFEASAVADVRELEGSPDASREDADASTADAPHDAPLEAPDGCCAAPRDAATADVDSGAECARGCALQGHWACWPMREQPTFAEVPGGMAVQDRCTGLQWEKVITSSSTYYTFADAKLACTSKNLGGAGWRMPTRLELASILDFTRGGPVLDTATFRTNMDQFWTSTATPDGAGAWTWQMYDGALQTKAQSAQYYGRCVRDPLGDIYESSTLLHFDRSVVGEVRDTATLLTWQTGDEQNTTVRSYASAEAYCVALGNAWRVPSVKEVLTIVDDSVVSVAGVPAAVNSELFPGALGAYYWTASTVYDSGATSQRWVVHFGSGVTSGTQASAYIRCVK